MSIDRRWRVNEVRRDFVSVNYGFLSAFAPDALRPVRRRLAPLEVRFMKGVGNARSHSRRFWLAILLTLAAPGCLSPLDLGGSPGGLIEPGMGPDPSYKPGIGDRAILFGTGADAPADMVPLLTDVTAFDKYERAVKQTGASQLSEMEQDGLLTRTSNGTRVSVLSLMDRTHVGDRYAAQVRVLDGTCKDRTAWTPATLVTRLIPIEPPK